MRHIFALISVLCLGAFCSQAAAHFIWVGTDKAQPDQAALWFSETPSPGEPEIISKIQPTAWIRTVGAPAKRLLDLKAVVQNEGAAMLATISETGPFSFEAIVDYGIYEFGGKVILLQYYAKHLNADSAEQVAAGRADSLPLDIVPRFADKQLELAILFEGQQARAAKLHVTVPGGDQQELKVDEQGIVRMPSPPAGQYAFRATLIQPDRTGTRDGKDYQQTRHYCTLTMKLPLDVAAISQAK